MSPGPLSSGNGSTTVPENESGEQCGSCGSVVFLRAVKDERDTAVSQSLPPPPISILNYFVSSYSRTSCKYFDFKEIFQSAMVLLLLFNCLFFPLTLSL